MLVVSCRVGRSTRNLNPSAPGTLASLHLLNGAGILRGLLERSAEIPSSGAETGQQHES